MQHGDEAFCREQLPRVSRTFALSIEALPERLQNAVRLAYLMCRVVDTIEDAAIAPDDRTALFDAFDRLLADPGADPAPFEGLATRVELAGERPDGVLCRRAGAVFRAFGRLPSEQAVAVALQVREMSEGMREYSAKADSCGGLAISDVADLERYCDFVAGTVGRMLTALFELDVSSLSGATRSALWARASRFGLGLQMVNVVKDIAADFERGVCFLPTSLAERHGVSLRDVLAPDQREAALRVVGDVCRTAREHLAEAIEYTLLWPVPEGAHVRLFCAVPLALALATLAEVERSEDTLVRGREPKVSRETVAKIFSEAHAAVGDDGALSAMFAGQDSGTPDSRSCTPHPH